MMDFGLTEWDVLLAFLGGLISSPGFWFALFGLVVSAGIFACLWCLLAVHRINHREDWE